MSQRPDREHEVPIIRPPMEEARRVALDRLIELERWIDKARDHATSSTLYELETDFQVIEKLAGTSAEQVLRVLRETGMLRDAAHSPEDQRPDEIQQRRERDREGY